MTIMTKLKKKSVKTNIDVNKVRESIVWCDGGEDYGHPLIYLNLKKEGKVTCPYCSKIFIYRK